MLTLSWDIQYFRNINTEHKTEYGFREFSPFQIAIETIQKTVFAVTTYLSMKNKQMTTSVVKKIVPVRNMH